MGSWRITYWLRHLVSVLILPVTVTVLVPLWISRRAGVGWTWPAGSGGWAIAGSGVAVLAVGLLLFGTSLRGFFVHGHGTLAPWDPPRRLVLWGPYRYVRNPMISGVIFTVAGVAMLLRSAPHAQWAAAFAAINAVYIPLSEEPMLEHRFGEDYREYCRHVRRFVPRLTAWGG